ncbi:TonB-dependent receptor [Sphingomonas mesophila]|uniref:TonB-dependent receptor n=1 Tax=Sphingomonas mesophila TaxID=2303576 RepID=UPI0013C30889|nr:TonB-dependent receptor [Sphingomonas mesophila]
MNVRAALHWSVGFAAVAAAAPAAAQQDRSAVPQTATSGTSVYDRGFFAGFAPRSALDIVQRTPGFHLDEGNSDVRGFAGAAGNVVFNGARPSSKSESLSTLLSRIPASRVVRVEVGPGSLYGSEYAGKSQVANLILSAAGGFDGNVTASARTLYTGAVIPNLTASATLKRGRSAFNLSAGTGRDDTADEGTDRIQDPDTGEVFEKRRKANRYRPRTPFVAGSWALEEAADRAIHLNARFSRFTEDFEQDNRVYVPGEPERDDKLYLTAESPAFEIGGDISRPLDQGTLKLVGLINRRKQEDLDTALERVDGVAIGGFEQGQEVQRNETLTRLSWTRPNLFGLAFEMGAEAALNTLDADLALFDLGPGGVRTRIDLPIDQAAVEEKRAEFYVKAGKQLSDALRIDAGLNYEFSDLKVRGDTTADRVLKFLKPSLTVDWKPGGGWHGQFVVRRTVAQLDFYDFISSAQLSDARVNGGNADLQPQRAWEARVSIDRPILGSGLIKLDVGFDQITMLQDRILTEEGFDAPGNIGTGKRQFARLAIDAPLDRLGLKGTRVKLQGTLQRTRVHDPISDEERDFSGFYPSWQWNAEIRRDVGQWAYGGEIAHRDKFTIFRASEEDVNSNSGIFGNAFVEYRPSGRTTLTLNVNNLFETQGIRDRLYTFPNRSFDGPNLREYRERNQHRTFQLTLKRNFGGGSATPS